MQAARRWAGVRSIPAEHALEASSWSSHGVRFSSTGESKAQPLGHESTNGFCQLKRTDTARRLTKPDFDHAELSQLELSPQ